MPTFILMTKLSQDSLGKLRDRQEMGTRWLDAVKQACPDIRWIDHYALLGPYDFMDIYEAPDQEEAAKVAMITMEKGALEAETWGAVPYKRFLELARKL